MSVFFPPPLQTHKTTNVTHRTDSKHARVGSGKDSVHYLEQNVTTIIVHAPKVALPTMSFPSFCRMDASHKKKNMNPTAEMQRIKTRDSEK